MYVLGYEEQRETALSARETSEAGKQYIYSHHIALLCHPSILFYQILFSLYPGNKTNRSLDEVATYIKLALDKV